jgi:hypothetical protein
MQMNSLLAFLDIHDRGSAEFPVDAVCELRLGQALRLADSSELTAEPRVDRLHRLENRPAGAKCQY